MAEIAGHAGGSRTSGHPLADHPLAVHPLDRPSRLGRAAPLLFLAIVLGGLAYVAYALAGDLAGAESVPWVLLGLALLIALGFEFVNGFHDTANAVATVIYTNAMPAELAVIWSGVFNFLGVMTASGAVAFGIISLLPVELILQVGSAAGLSMVFALLLAAIVWNLGTWYLGIPASSSHTLVGSIIGVGLANDFLAPAATATSGVDWTKATEVGLALLVSPLVGFVAAGALLLVLKRLVRNPALYAAPQGGRPPPPWIRALLIFTCTGVSFAHGSNDGQKGMGLIMLVLIGLVPTAFALNRTGDANLLARYKDAASVAELVLERHAAPGVEVPDARAAVEAAVRFRRWTPQATVALRRFIAETDTIVSPYQSVDTLPTALVANARNDIYLISEALKLLEKSPLVAADASAVEVLHAFHDAADDMTKFIPLWVKVAVALALGLGTMIGWKRIVVTVGEKIGKSHLTYGQGASAELTAMLTIGAADGMGLPVSTTHVLSSGVAGTMAANRSGLQWSTVHSLLLAWVLTLPASVALSFLLFLLFRAVF